MIRVNPFYLYLNVWKDAKKTGKNKGFANILLSLYFIHSFMKALKLYISSAIITLFASVLYSCMGEGKEPISNQWEAFTIAPEGPLPARMGILHTLTGDTLIPPGEYIAAKADSNIILLTLPDGRIRAHSDRGLPIGPTPFDSFIPIGLENSSEVYYLGTTRHEKFYYFPKRHLTVDARHMVCNNGAYFGRSERDGSIQVFDFKGNRIWKAPAGSRVVFPNPNLRVDFVIALPGDTARCLPNGERIKNNQ